jgi:hypothetical protein
MAERRGDDFCDIGTLLITDDSQRMAFAAEASAEYGRIYGAYRAKWPTIEVASVNATPRSPLDDLDPQVIAASVLPERDRLGELARLAGQARYAMDGHDSRLLDEVSAQMKVLASTLPEKYRAGQLVESAVRPDRTNERLAELYLQRAYRLLEEDYNSIPPIEQEIRDLREHSGE